MIGWPTSEGDVITGGAVFDHPFAVGPVFPALIGLAFILDRRFRVFPFFGSAGVGMSFLLRTIVG